MDFLAARLRYDLCDVICIYNIFTVCCWGWEVVGLKSIGDRHPPCGTPLTNVGHVQSSMVIDAVLLDM